MKILSLNKIEKLKLIGLCIKAVTGVIGGSLIIAEGYPYVALSVLAIGAAANEVVSFLKERENQSKTNEISSTDTTSE